MILGRVLRIFYVLSACAVFFSCSSTKNSGLSESGELSGEKSFAAGKTECLQKKSEITLVFAGDIMAHKNNYSFGNFSAIWDGIRIIVQDSDLAFANVEAPVNDDMAWNTYPQFNMHSEYIDASINAGFNVFSLANNHTNDWYKEGMTATQKYFESKKNVWACGIKKTSGGSISYSLIEKNDWKILFFAVTEILNRKDFASYIDYFPAAKKSREALVSEILKVKEKNPSDLTVLSIHTDEEEYKTEISKTHENFYKSISEQCGIDIIWANHPHVSKPWKVMNAGGKDVLVMFANGNTISGQRTSPSLGKKTHNSRDNTGDGLLIRAVYEKTVPVVSEFSDESKFSDESEIPELVSLEPFFITSYITKTGQTVIRVADDDFIESLAAENRPQWVSYLTERRKIFENIKEKSKWQ